MAVDRLASRGILQVNSPGDNRPHWVTIGENNQNYWSGLNAAIWFNDLYIGEIVSLQYEIQESVYPLFNYASRTKEGAMHGARRVFGQFTVNWQQAILFWLILEHIRRTSNGVTKAIRDATKSNFGLDSKVQINPVSAAFSAQTLLGRGVLKPATVTQLGEITTLINNNTTSVRKLADLSSAIKAADATTIKADADKLRAKFNWASANTKIAPAGNSLLTAVRSALVTQDLQSMFDTPNGFNIIVRMGDQNPEDYLDAYSVDGDLGTTPQAYDLSYLRALEQFDNGDVDQALAQMPPYTTETVTGINVTGFGKVIDDSGRPILQTYSFIAKDIVPGQI